MLLGTRFGNVCVKYERHFFGGKLLTPLLFKADFKINLILWVLFKSLFLLLSNSWFSQVLFSQDRLWHSLGMLIPAVCPIHWMDKTGKKQPRADGPVYAVQPWILKPWSEQWGLHDKVHHLKDSELLSLLWRAHFYVKPDLISICVGHYLSWLTWRWLKASQHLQEWSWHVQSQIWVISVCTSISHLCLRAIKMGQKN